MCLHLILKPLDSFVCVFCFKVICVFQLLCIFIRFFLLILVWHLEETFKGAIYKSKDYYYYYYYAAADYSNYSSSYNHGVRGSSVTLVHFRRDKNVLLSGSSAAAVSHMSRCYKNLTRRPLPSAARPIKARPRGAALTFPDQKCCMSENFSPEPEPEQHAASQMPERRKPRSRSRTSHRRYGEYCTFMRVIIETESWTRSRSESESELYCKARVFLGNGSSSAHI